MKPNYTLSHFNTVRFLSLLLPSLAALLILASGIQTFASPLVRLPARDLSPESLISSPRSELITSTGYTQAFSDPASLVYLPLIRKDRTGLVVDTRSRSAVVDFYNQHYLAYENTPLNWTGNHAGCEPGATNPAARDAVIHRVNYFRAMAGVPGDITRLDEYDTQAQAAALVMSVNRALSHTPPSNWTCYSQTAYDGASRSNLSLGNHVWNAVTSQFRDAGSNNYYVGHRRWILYPQTQVMGTGDIPPTSGFSAANALYVVDVDHYHTARPPTRDPFVAWPPPGYVPYQVVYARWSFSYPNADFSAAQVTMTSAGAPAPVTYEPVHNSPGDNTLVWLPFGLKDYSAWPKPPADQVIQVTVSNVLIGGQPQDFTYEVIVITP